MTKTVLITGSTDGLGLETAKALAALGHQVILHGRSPEKLLKACQEVSASSGQPVDGFEADLTDLPSLAGFVENLSQKHAKLDVLINNAGVFKTSQPRLPSGLDVRFVVNTVAPYLLFKLLADKLAKDARIVNLSSAAQAPLDMDAFWGERSLSDSAAYAQSKLALTAWTQFLGKSLAEKGPMLVSVNPGSFLATKMVKEAYGSSGNDIAVGVDILRRAALSEEFAGAHGRYFDNDSGQFSNPHPGALDTQLGTELVQSMDKLISEAM